MNTTAWPDTRSWQSLVEGSSEATFFHTPLWHEIVVAAYRDYGIATRQFLFEDGARAVFPFIQTKKGGIIRGKSRLKSSVFGGYGGIIADRKLSPEQYRMMYRTITRLKASVSVDTNPFTDETLPDSFSAKHDYTQVSRLAAGDDCFIPKLSRGAKSNLNQARKKGVTVRVLTAEQDISAYYNIYLDTLKRWGDAVLFTYPEELFFTVYRLAGDHVRIWLAEKDSVIIAGAVIFYWNSIASYWQGASLQDYFSCYPNNMLHMEIIRDAARRGYAYYDFGPSGGQEGVERFKKSFGAEKFSFDSGLLRYGKKK